MGMGTRRRRQRQEQLWISHNELAKGSGHPFYKRVNELLEMKQFDEFAEKECARFYAENNGRPSVTPGIYFRLDNSGPRGAANACRMGVAARVVTTAMSTNIAKSVGRENAEVEPNI